MMGMCPDMHSRLAVFLVVLVRTHCSATVCEECTFSTDNAGTLIRQPAGCICRNSLVLQGGAIKALPNRIFEGLGITSLVLSNNTLDSLGSDVFRGLPNLEVLTIERSGIKELPESLFLPVAHVLRRLSLADNRIRALPRNIFRNLSALEDLDVSLNSITVLPREIFNGLQARLRQLSLAANKLEILPNKAFAGFYALESLNLSLNNLTKLPIDIFEDSGRSLSSLDLSSNALTSIPPNFFAGLGSIQRVYLNHNRIQTLPANFQGLTFSGLAGVSLFLSSNQISEVQAGAFAGIARLTYLDLSWNRISSISPDAFTSQTFDHLKFLHLSVNRISNLPSTLFGVFTRCHTLVLGGNRLKSVPFGLFDKMESLQILSLGNNEIEHIPAGSFDAFAVSAREIVLADNRLKSLPSGLFTSMTNLRALVLGDNPFEDTVESAALPDLNFLSQLAALAILDLHNIQPTIIAGVKTLWPLGNVGTGCHNCKFSRHIDGTLHRDESSQGCGECVGLNFGPRHSPSLSGMYLRAISINAFTGMTGLTHIGLDRNAFASLHEDLFRKLPNLELVDMTSSVHTELGAIPIGCIPIFRNSHALLRVEIRIGLPVSLTSQAAGMWASLEFCPAACVSGAWYHRGSKACIECEPGTYASGAGAAPCSPCPPAQYAASRGATACTNCTWHASSSIGSKHISDCSCLSGFALLTFDGTPRCELIPMNLGLDLGQQNNDPASAESKTSTLQQRQSSAHSTRVAIVVGATVGGMFVATCLVIITLRHCCNSSTHDHVVTTPPRHPATADQICSIDDDDEVLEVTPYCQLPGRHVATGLSERKHRQGTLDGDGTAGPIFSGNNDACSPSPRVVERTFQSAGSCVPGELAESATSSLSLNITPRPAEESFGAYAEESDRKIVQPQVESHDDSTYMPSIYSVRLDPLKRTNRAKRRVLQFLTQQVDVHRPSDVELSSTAVEPELADTYAVH